MCLGRLTVAERKATNLKPPIDLGGESTRNKKPNLFGLLVGVDGGYAKLLCPDCKGTFILGLMQMLLLRLNEFGIEAVLLELVKQACMTKPCLALMNEGIGKASIGE